MTKPPVLSVKQMSEFAMRPTHAREYRLQLLAHLERENGKDYAEAVRLQMNVIQAQRKKHKSFK